MWISIPKRHIVAWDSICSSISPVELDVYIECHALGMEFSKKDFAKANGKTMRDKMAVDIFQELPDAHEFENKDNDANLGAYEGLMCSGMLDDLTISSLEILLSSDLLARPSQICLVVQFDKEVDTDKFITQIFNT
ncbi:unnamed protein product [Brassica oleracea]